MEGRKEVDLLLVWAGHEPQEFINYFPQWEINLDVQLYNTEVSSGVNQIRTFELLIISEISKSVFLWYLMNYFDNRIKPIFIVCIKNCTIALSI